MRFHIDPAAYLAAQLRPHGLNEHCDNDEAILYRFFDESGAILYVGVTVNPPIRWQAHKRRASWWGRVRSVHIESHPHTNAALDAELAAITAERPPFNIRSAPEDFRRGSGADPRPCVSGREEEGKGMEWSGRESYRTSLVVSLVEIKFKVLSPTWTPAPRNRYLR